MLLLIRKYFVVWKSITNSMITWFQIEARSVDHIKKVNLGLENKVIELQQKLMGQVSGEGEGEGEDDNSDDDDDDDDDDDGSDGYYEFGIWFFGTVSAILRLSRD